MESFRMEAHRKTTDAVEILMRRYIGDDPEKLAALERERVNLEVARMVYDRRVEAGLSQKALAELVGTTQSVISRLEDADYEGHSLTMLQRIATALKLRLKVTMIAEEPTRYVRARRPGARKKAARR